MLTRELHETATGILSTVLHVGPVHDYVRALCTEMDLDAIKKIAGDMAACVPEKTYKKGEVLAAYIIGLITLLERIEKDEQMQERRN